jgi:hypothetical protein
VHSDKAVKDRMRCQKSGRNLRIELRLMATKTDGVLEAQEEACVAASTREVKWGWAHDCCQDANRGGVGGGRVSGSQLPSRHLQMAGVAPARSRPTTCQLRLDASCAFSMPREVSHPSRA